ncbi:UvrD-helicase domain-containing protein [Micrococcoides hystricis]|uniref:UvrD-helicase domain-containing protein n=1 Tax=Micrococcoides hystricis TaxID=1572761 RepID=A0ABV6P843_9MICC
MKSTAVDATHEHSTERAEREIYQQELAREQAHVDRCYNRLDELHAEKQQQLAQLRRGGAQGSLQNVSERDSFATLYEDRIAQLEAVDERLVFGRLDLEDGPITTRYIGRLGLSETDQTRLLVDWRAPEASSFYQATAADPLGVRRRRHLMLAGRKVRGIEDDVLDPELLNEDQTLQGQGALLAALTAHRTGQMGDIVATIQSEQDAIIRAPINQALVVQGGPGTGKTAVALHRAAYLLYTHRDRLENSGVLLIGPSDAFLHYIERVLPALGETGVSLRSLQTMLPGVQVTAEEVNPRARYLKGQQFMADVVHNAVSLRQRRIAENRTLRVGGHDLTLKTSTISKALETARNSEKPHNQAREVFVKTVLRRLLEQYQKVLAKAMPGKHQDEAIMMDELRNSRDVKVALNLCWMPLDAHQLISELFSKPDYLADAAFFLSEADRSVLLRDAEHGVTEDDLPLLDLAMDLLGPLPVRGAKGSNGQAQRDLENAQQAVENVRSQMAEMGIDGFLDADKLAALNSEGGPSLSDVERLERERQWTYGHIVIDEAQELSPMQWQFLAKRCPVKSFTIVGDIAQASAPASARSWAEAMAPVVEDRYREAALTVNYRTPEQIMDLAHSWAAAQQLPYTHTSAVRVGEFAPERIYTTAADLAETVNELVQRLLPEQGMMAIIVPADLKENLQGPLSSSFAERLGTGAGTVERNLVVLTATEAKGLEFDVVALVEPLRIAADQGSGDLFVAMTRATNQLAVISTEQLPQSLL